MALGVLAYPSVSNDDYNRIQAFRKTNDELYYQLVDPHFAFVFPTESLEEQEFIEEIKEKAKGFASFDFELKCACVNKDSIIDYFHLLLVPDIGHSHIVKLHDILYSDRLFNELRLDIDFIPHVGIANSKDRFKVKNWADQWNANPFSIKGQINMLTVIKYDGHQLEELMNIPLGDRQD
jgi:hypothetical protein